MTEDHERPPTLEDLTMPNGWVWSDPLVAAECKGLFKRRGRAWVFMMFVRGKHPEKGCPLNNEQIAKEIRVSVRSVSGYIKTFVSNGFLRVVVENGQRRLFAARRFWWPEFDVEPHVRQSIEDANRRTLETLK